MRKIDIRGMMGLFLMASATAGDLKVHTWPCEVNSAIQVATVDIVLDVGYYIHILDQSPLIVVQDSQSLNPYKTYSGCKKTSVDANMRAELSASARATSLAVGLWTARVTPRFIQPGTTDIEICVTGRNVNIRRLNAGRENVRVAEVSIQVNQRL